MQSSAYLDCRFLDQPPLMNKFAKALLLSLVFAAPVAMSAPAVQAKPVSAHTQMAKASSQQAGVKAKKKRMKRKATRNTVTNPPATKAVGVHK